jgi:hypothetical protein
MHPQLRTIEEELVQGSEGIRMLAEELSPEQWNACPQGGGWSPAECVRHLNLTSEAMVPPIRDAIDRARSLGGGAPARFRRGFLGWLLWSGSRPGKGIRVRTSPAFVPEPGAIDVAALLAESDRWQREQLELVRAADGLPLHRVRIASPFGPRIHYSAFAALSILSVHQLRHLDQARRAATAAG